MELERSKDLLYQERTQLRWRERSYGGKNAATAEIKQLRRRLNSYGARLSTQMKIGTAWQLSVEVTNPSVLREISTKQARGEWVDQEGYLKRNQEFLKIPSQINWNFSINYLFILIIIQSSRRTGDCTRLNLGSPL